MCRSVVAPDYKYRWRGRNRSPILLTIIMLLIVRAEGRGQIWTGHWHHMALTSDQGTGARDRWWLFNFMKCEIVWPGPGPGTWLHLAPPDRIRDVRTAEPLLVSEMRWQNNFNRNLGPIWYLIRRWNTTSLHRVIMSCQKAKNKRTISAVALLYFLSSLLKAWKN